MPDGDGDKLPVSWGADLVCGIRQLDGFEAALQWNFFNSEPGHRQPQVCANSKQMWLLIRRNEAQRGNGKACFETLNLVKKKKDVQRLRRKRGANVYFFFFKLKFL